MHAWVLELSKWEGQILFTRPLVSFLLLLLLLAGGVLLCIWGYRYLRTLLILIMAAFLGYGAILLADAVTESLLGKMSLFMIVLFVATCVVYYLSPGVGYLLRKIDTKGSLRKHIPQISAVLGGAVLGVSFYFGIYQRLWAAVLLFGIAAVFGSWYQNKKKKKQVRFLTYDQLAQMPYPKERVP